MKRNFFYSLAAFIAALVCIFPVAAQNMKDDAVSNDLDALKAKVELLEPDLTDCSLFASDGVFLVWFRENRGGISKGCCIPADGCI